MLGYDFLPFYTAGSFVREGRHRELYNLNAMGAAERATATAAKLQLGDALGPFWNPPFYALPFAPLAALSFRAAWVVWMSVNVAALAVAVVLLCRMLPASATASPHLAVGTHRWSPPAWGLVPLLTLFSVPCILALTHGQNSCVSLLLLTATVVAWRAGRGYVAGLLCGLLAYKPQLAALVAVVLAIDLGWRAAAGLLTTGALLGLLTLVALPGSAGDYLHGLPRILHYMQVERPYMWERHATLRAFWRLLLQGRAAGEVATSVQLLTAGCSLALLSLLLVAAVRSRRADGPVQRRFARDRLIAATVVVMPLVMPFYFDYDLLLLAVPAVLLAADGERAGRWLLSAWCGLFVWLTVNPDTAAMTRVNLAVPLLAAVAVPMLARAVRRAPAAVESERTPLPLRAAA